MTQTRSLRSFLAVTLVTLGLVGFASPGCGGGGGGGSSGGGGTTAGGTSGGAGGTSGTAAGGTATGGGGSGTTTGGGGSTTTGGGGSASGGGTVSGGGSGAGAGGGTSSGGSGTGTGGGTTSGGSGTGTSGGTTTGGSGTGTSGGTTGGGSGTGTSGGSTGGGSGTGTSGGTTTGGSGTGTSGGTTGGGTTGGGTTGGGSGTGSGTLPAGVGAVEIDAGALNVRLGPGTGFQVIGEAHDGEVYVAFDREGSWRRIWFHEAPAWVHEGYLKPAPAGVTVRAVNAINLNVRRGAGTQYDVVGRAYEGHLVAVQATSGDWRKVSFGGQQAWVFASYLGAPGSAPAIGVIAPDRPQSTRGFIQLPAAGPGFYGYNRAAARWGTVRMVYGLERIARLWQQDHPSYPRMGVGDISLENGGDIAGHVSHEKGVDVDMRTVKTAGEGAGTIFDSDYSRARTSDLIQRFYQHLPITLVLFNDTAVSGTQTWPNHDNHFHARIEE